MENENTPTITTHLDLNIDAIVAFLHDEDLSQESLDISPFVELSVLPKAHRWEKKGRIAVLKPNAKLEWTISPTLINYEIEVVLRNIRLEFQTIGKPNGKKIDENSKWESVFQDQETSLYKPLKVKVQDKQLEGDQKNILLDENLVVRDPLEITNSLTYSIKFDFKIQEKSFHFRIDPLLKNNSNDLPGGV